MWDLRNPPPNKAALRLAGGSEAAPISLFLKVAGGVRPHDELRNGATISVRKRPRTKEGEEKEKEDGRKKNIGR